MTTPTSSGPAAAVGEGPIIFQRIQVHTTNNMGNAQPRPTASSAKDFRDERSRIKQLLSTNNSGSFFGLENVSVCIIVQI